MNPELPHSPERILHSLAGPAYDSVWALALAYHQELQLSQTLELSKVLFQINNLSFSGISVSTNGLYKLKYGFRILSNWTFFTLLDSMY